MAERRIADTDVFELCQRPHPAPVHDPVKNSYRLEGAIQGKGRLKVWVTPPWPPGANGIIVVKSAAWKD